MIDKKVQKKQYMRKYYEKTKYYLIPRTRLIQLLGNSCINCGFNDIRALQIDHINGGGNQESEMMGPYSMYTFYLNNIIFAHQRLQVLCANCNWIKKSINKEHRKYNKKI